MTSHDPTEDCCQICGSTKCSCCETCGMEKCECCPRCSGSGRVTTADYESYFGADYKPCPECGGDPCPHEPPIS